MEIIHIIEEKGFVPVVVLEKQLNSDNQVGVIDTEVLMEKSPSIDRNLVN